MKDTRLKRWLREFGKKKTNGNGTSNKTAAKPEVGSSPFEEIADKMMKIKAFPSLAEKELDYSGGTYLQEQIVYTNYKRQVGKSYTYFIYGKENLGFLAAIALRRSSEGESEAEAIKFLTALEVRE